MEETAPQTQQEVQPQKPEVPRDKFSKREIGLLIFIMLAILGVTVFVWQTDKNKKAEINSFATCVAAGNPVMESYPEQCAANGQTYTNPDQQLVDQTSPNPLEEIAVKTSYSQLPSELQSLIMSEIVEQTPDCVVEGKIVNGEGQPVDPAVAYASLSSATMPMGCEGGFLALFGKNKEGSWIFVQGTQEKFTCSVVAQYSVPESLLSMSFNGETNCFDEATKQLREFDTLYL